MSELSAAVDFDPVSGIGETAGVGAILALRMALGLLGLNGSDFDWTALGTLALAAATFVSVLAARRGLKATQDQLAQTQEEIALSRREVEEAHRPIVVPVADDAGDHPNRGHRRVRIDLSILYKDVAGKAWITSAKYVPAREGTRT